MIFQPASNIQVPFMQQWPRGRAAGGGGGFVPTDIAGLRWYETDNYDPLTGVCADSGNLTPVILSQASAGARPLKQAGIVNGRDVRRYDGSDDVLVGSAVSIGSAITIAVVAATRDAPPYSGVGAILGSASLNCYVTNQFGSTSSTFASADNSAVNFDTWVNGVSIPSGSISGDFPSSGFGLLVVSFGALTPFTSINEGLTGSFYGKVDIAEQLIFDSVLSPTDRGLVESYLMAKYAL